MPSKLRKAIAAVKDQTSISIAKVSNNHYTNLEVAVLKATTHDDSPIDERYVHEVLQLVSADKIYAAACTRAIGKRIGRTRNWIVALKSLTLVSRIFQAGDPYFPREVLHAMTKGVKILNLSTFRDDSSSSPWDYTAFVRTFALYLDEHLDCFITGKLQRRYTNIDNRREEKGGQRTNDSIGDMKPSVLINSIAYWQCLLQRTIATSPTGAAMTNRLVQISLQAVVQESFHLYKDISEGLNLLVKCFFHLRYKDCVNAFKTFSKARSQFAELGDFYSLCKRIGVGSHSEYPSVETLSEERIETLREFLKDQSSFPSVSRSPNRLALPSLPNSNATPQESFRRENEFSKTRRRRFSHKASKFGSERTSSEDLLDATQNGTSQCTSIDLEAYSDHFKQQTDRDETFQMSKSASTLSLPVSNTMADLISLDDWSGQEQETEAKNIKEEQRQQTNAPTGWELVLAEAIQLPSTQSEPNAPCTPNVHLEKKLQTFSALPEKEYMPTFNAVPEQHKWQHTNALPAYKFCPEQKPNTYSAFPEHIPTFNTFPEREHERQHTKSGEGWENVLAENATQPVQPSFDSNLMYNKHVPSVSNTFNAFPEQEQKGKETSSRQSWELVLFETAKQPTKQTSFSLQNYYPQTSVLPTFSLDNFNNQPAQLPLQHYNPFLEDSNESAIVPVVTGSTIAAFETSFPEKRFLSAHTFQVTPTFTAHDIDTGKGALSAPTFQATQNFSAQIPENDMKALPASAFQATPTFSAHNPDNRKVALSAPISQANPTFSPHYLDNGTGASSALTFQATPTCSQSR
ncbi:clathrin coat assembly protein AP180-like [Heracleum sosnowskyi]|uniref:Clathrin coat assembly protein AP180-like n=1 Tax=Heracleum sosnowskyi TaxID=360622 RepID=A0AAD8LYY3_9APIA|nr:clathrin coat assembly protein AP180-like [Heracleum sosnowskyi]